eukprot:1864396-Alexandrium_andersonii.AAC.1
MAPGPSFKDHYIDLPPLVRRRFQEDSGVGSDRGEAKASQALPNPLSPEPVRVFSPKEPPNKREAHLPKIPDSPPQGGRDDAPRIRGVQNLSQASGVPLKVAQKLDPSEPSFSTGPLIAENEL